MKKYNDSLYIDVDITPSWIKSEKVEKLSSSGLEKILLFFVVFCPCEKYATQQRTLSYHGWKAKPWSPSGYLKDTLDNAAMGLFLKNRRMVSWREFKQTWNSSELGEKQWYSKGIELAICSKVEDSIYMTIFYHIRCALAHGRFMITRRNGENFFAFENGVTKDKRFYVKAWIVLKEATLLEWIKIIERGPNRSMKNAIR